MSEGPQHPFKLQFPDGKIRTVYVDSGALKANIEGWYAGKITKWDSNSGVVDILTTTATKAIPILMSNRLAPFIESQGFIWKPLLLYYGSGQTITKIIRIMDKSRTVYE